MDNNWHTISIMSFIFSFFCCWGQFLPFLMCLEQMSSFLTRICVRIYFASTISLDFFQKVWNFWKGIDNVNQERNIYIKTGDLCLIVAWSSSYESGRIISCTVHWIQLNCWSISGLVCVPCERSGRKILFQHNKDMFTKKHYFTIIRTCFPKYLSFSLWKTLWTRSQEQKNRRPVASG